MLHRQSTQDAALQVFSTLATYDETFDAAIQQILLFQHNVLSGPEAPIYRFSSQSRISALSLIGETLNDYVTARITTGLAINKEFASITKSTVTSRALRLLSELTSNIDVKIDADLHTSTFASDLKLLNTLALLTNTPCDDLITNKLQTNIDMPSKAWREVWMLIPGFVCDSQSVSRGFVQHLVSLDGIRKTLQCAMKNSESFGSNLIGQLRNVIAVNPPLCNYLCKSNILTECLEIFGSALSGARSNFQQLAIDLIESLSK